jgi:hypothetical protein
MYDAVEDPYCYPGTTVLKNKLNLREKLLGLRRVEERREDFEGNELSY